jgi:Flp pilus assembly protein TadG
MKAFLKQRGQAIVEFALAATLIFFLLAAAVDLGLMFFAVQGLHNAAQEGGTYGSRWLMSSGTAGTRVLDVSTIRDRVRQESGSRGGIGVVNLLDLNNNGTPDVNAGVLIKNCSASTCERNPATGAYIVNEYIQVAMIDDANLNGDPLDDGAAPNYTACTNANSPTCFVRVRVSFDYRLFFPLSPTFGRERKISSQFVMRLRDDMAREGAPQGTPPVFRPATPTPQPPTPTPQVITVDIVGFSYSSWSDTASVRAYVELNGNPLSVANVQATITRGSTTKTVAMSAIGNGYYRVCNVGTFSNTPSVSVTATYNSTSASDSASGTGGSTGC